jgi:hypothetical protein
MLINSISQTSTRQTNNRAFHRKNVKIELIGTRFAWIIRFQNFHNQLFRARIPSHSVNTRTNPKSPETLVEHLATESVDVPNPKFSPRKRPPAESQKPIIVHEPELAEPPCPVPNTPKAVVLHSGMAAKIVLWATAPIAIAQYGGFLWPGAESWRN